MCSTWTRGSQPTPRPIIVVSFSEATVAWNAALNAALLLTPPEIASQIPKLDREVDRLLDQAVSRPMEPRRVPGGADQARQMAAEYLRHARNCRASGHRACLDLGLGR